ncbi:MAG: SIMPL domain-containing protein [Gemmatimonadota bacterium]|nr:SIMPL domain-containing protein [Gemmatimonadota bacterium]
MSHHPHAALPLLLLALSAGGAPSAQAQMTESSPPFVEVSGTASVSVTPDLAVVTFAVETEAASAEEAAQENAERMEQVLAAVRGTGLDQLRVETHGYSLQPVYRADEKPGEMPRIAGYRALNHVEARTSAVQRSGRLIDAAIGAGANRVTGLSFRASDPEPARLEAVERAVDRARAQAEAMARALGVPLGRVLEVRGGAESPPPRPWMARSQMAMAADTPIEVGEQQISATVTVRFALGTDPEP